jgi:hypothetical protein
MRQTLKYVLQQALERMGLVLISRRHYTELQRTRSQAVADLTQHAMVGLKPGLAGVVFSKDRAFQLHGLLRSYLDLVTHAVPLTIIYNASNAGHAKAYEEVAASFKKSPVKFTFIREDKPFREVLPKVLAAITVKNIFFLVDDIVFVQPYDLRLAATIDPLNFILCPRLSPHLRRSYTANVKQMPPKLTPAEIKLAPELLQFKWYEAGNEWAYPWSVDGNVYSVAEIRVLTQLVKFKAPNTYEGALQEFAAMVLHRPGLCYPHSKIVNLAINRVQNEVANLSGDISADYLLEQWQQGLMMDVAALRGHVPQAPHEVLPIATVPRG